MEFKKYVGLFLAAFFLMFVPAASSYAEVASGAPLRLTVFYSVSCHECIKIKSDFIPQVEKKFGMKLEWDYRDIADIENYKMLLGLKRQYGGPAESQIPTIFIAGRFLTGEAAIRKSLIPLIENALAYAYVKKEAAETADIVLHFEGFTPLAIIGAGLIDGINPCAFTVIVFFISFLSLQGYRKKELISIGLIFIVAVFLTYLFIGLGLFNFLYRLKAFLYFARIINFLIGIFCLLLGLLAVNDFFKFKKNRQAEGLTLQLPQAVKNQIHRIIGLFYRRTQKINAEPFSIPLFRLLAAALITGFLVSILEAVCTGQVYLPTIVFVLKTTHLKLEALGYLLLYNLMFVLPLFIIFIFALLGATSAQFAKFLNKNLLAIKILMAGLFFSLGILLIWRA